jgi:hypothetical protein
MIRRCDEACHKQRAVMACITVMRCSEAAGHPMCGEGPEKYIDTTNFRINQTSSSKFTSHPRLIQYFELQTIDKMKSSNVLASFALFFASVMAQTACAPAASAIPTCGVCLPLTLLHPPFFLITSPSPLSILSIPLQFLHYMHPPHLPLTHIR